MPEQQSGNTLTSTSRLSDLTLAVRIDGVPEQEVFLQHGLSLGRNPSNTICINEPDIERIHAMVCRQADGSMVLECTDEHLRLTLPDGSQVHSLPLKAGTTFRLGKAVIRCLKRETRPTVVVSDNPWEVRCPRCHETIVGLPHDAGHCPKCELPIQYFQSHSGTNLDGTPQTMPRAVGEFEGWLPREIGPYKIRAFVAQGGMGIILRGLHKESDLPAAVKLLKVDSDEEPTWKQRFMAEIDTLKTLRHPNVVHLQDHGKDDKLLWLAMDWIDGDSLSKIAGKARSAGKEIPIDEIRITLTQVAAGLQYLHGRQIIHRDLKPSNVLMAHDALVKLVDFGIARAASGQTSVMTQLTHTGMVAGTESYMSPEQAEGQTITPASDIYSLGVMWYELVTGRRPVGAFMSPSVIRRDCPAAWSNTIAQCLSVSPQGRPSLAMISQVLAATAEEPAAPPPLAPPPIPIQPAGPGIATPPRIPTGVAQPPPPPISPHQPPRAPTTPTGTPNSGMAQAQKIASDAGRAVVSATKTASAAVQTFLQKNPPAKLLDKMGPVGTKIKSNKGPAIAIGAVVVLVLVVLIIRGCSSGSTTTGGGGTTATDTGGTNAGGDTTAQKIQQQFQQQQQPNRAQQQTHPPRDIADGTFREGVGLMTQSFGPTDVRFRRGLADVTDAANQGNTQAMLYLATLYGSPQYQVYDYQKAVGWARKAQAAGDPNAAATLYQLGQQP